jgi:hypothetical protein
MRRALLALVLPLAGCTCSKPVPEETRPAASASASPAPTASAAAETNVVLTQSDARFSAPIGAARLPGGAVAVAGLVVERKSIGLLRMKLDGAVELGVQAIRDVAWTADAELKVFAVGDGVAVVWRGAHASKSSRWLAFVDKDGTVKGDPLEIGASPCATTNAVAWFERRTDAEAHIRGRVWGEANAKQLGIVPKGREPSLACADKRVFAFGDGERDVLLLAAPFDAPPTAMTLVEDQDFGEDETRGHEAFTAGDDLTVLRVGDSGALAMRDVRGTSAEAWTKIKHKVGSDDDIVAVDGDANAATIVYTRGESSKCRGEDDASSLHALRIDRKTKKETVTRIAAFECGKHRGPYWIAPLRGGHAVAWADREKKRDATSPPISGLGFRVLDGEGAASHAAQPADALVDAGCDATACHAVALVREPGSDGMKPERVRLVRFP